MKVASQIFALALAVTAFAPNAVDAAAAQCAVPASTLSFECTKWCSDSQPCVLGNTTKAVSECAPTCVKALTTTAKDFTFLVPFGKWKSAQEKASNGALPKDDPQLASGLAGKSNDELTKIAQVKLPDATVNVNIRGGSAESKSVKSRVANVEFAADLMAKAPQVKNLKIENFDLNKQAEKLVAGFPEKLDRLYLANNLLTEAPASISKLKALSYLDLSYNYISKLSDSLTAPNLTTLLLSYNNFTEMPSPKAIPNLKTLYLINNSISNVPATSARDGLLELYVTENKLTKFEATFKSLTDLVLSDNKFEKVPEAIATHKNLKVLRLNYNKIYSYPANQLINGLKTLDLSNTMLIELNANFTTLEWLELQDTRITAIPPMVFLNKNLSSLYLHSNKNLKDVTVTAEQAKFLSGIKYLQIDASSLRKDCGIIDQVKIKDYTVCLTGSKVVKSTTKTAHHHHHKRSHHKRSHHHHEADAPQEPTPVEETTTQLAATDASAAAASNSNNNTLIVALSSAVGGFAVAMLVVLAAVTVKKLNRESVNDESASVDEELESSVDDSSDSSDDNGENVHGVVSV